MERCLLDECLLKQSKKNCLHCGSSRNILIFRVIRLDCFHKMAHQSDCQASTDCKCVTPIPSSLLKATGLPALIDAY